MGKDLQLFQINQPMFPKLYQLPIGQLRPMNLVAGIRSEEYYVNMMIAWYFATALAKQYEGAVPHIQDQ